MIFDLRLILTLFDFLFTRMMFLGFTVIVDGSEINILSVKLGPASVI